ncbi:MAG: F0F1 ATP synthase subunit A [Chitinophagales bacterium]|nr:F0F1 ATP synthase subunit A [Chitinophagales bacterium]MDW8273487.1 F0F1 ATP synthase subunit A [Chitinophagales bacterium]
MLRTSLLIVFSLLFISVFAEQQSERQESSGKKEVYNPTPMILHHIADANEFEIVHGLAVPLPCIIYNFTTGKLSFFMSNNREKMVAEGYVLDHGRVKPLNKEEKILDLSITKNVFGMLLASLLLIIVFFNVKSAYEKNKFSAPRGLQSLLEPVIIFVRDDIAKQALGNKAEYYLPYLMTAFFFILTNNLLGLVPIFPGSANVTGNIAVTMVLALITGIIINVKANKYYWKHIFLPEPLWMAPLLIPVELLGVLTKPITLMIRLFANIAAGHIIVLSLISLIFVFGSIWGVIGSGVGALVAVPFTLFISVIELLVAFIQAFIFTMLSAVFISMAIEEHHGHEAH